MTEGSSGFQRQLGLFDVTMLVSGAMIGSGIFIVSAEIARDTGGAGWLLAVWGLAGLLTVMGALCYAELAAQMPHAGGQYVFLREAYGPLWGFLYGWTLFLVIQTGSIAAVAVAFAKFLGVLQPALGDKAVLWSWPLNLVLHVPLPWLDKPLVLLELKEFTITSGQLVAAAVVILLTAVNCSGVRAGKWVQNIFTVAKTSALVLMILLGLILAVNSGIWNKNMADAWSGIESTARFKAVHELAPWGIALPALMVMGGAMVGALFSADAWNNVTFASSEVKNPRRTIPLGLALGTGLVIALYLLANLVYLGALPIDGVEAGVSPLDRGIAHARNDRVGTAVLELVSPRFGVAAMAIGVMISTFGCVNGLILMGARLYYAMARDGLFFQSVGRLNKQGVPAAGLIFQAAWALLLTFSGTYGQLLDYVIFAALLFYVLTVGGLFVLRFRLPNAERPFRVFGYPWLPACYMILCGLIMVDLLIVKPQFTWPGLMIVLAGIPVYFAWRIVSKLAPKSAAKIDR